MNKAQLVDGLVSRKEIAHLSKKDTEAVINAMIDVIRQAVKSGDDVSLTGFGTFTKIKRSARVGVNPSTGEKIQIDSKVLPKFRAGKAWKDML